jgi:hypothetical protein
MNLIQCYQTHSSWYKGAVKGGTPIGVLWHDTGAGNPNLKRYVQPYEGDANYDKMIALIGKNTNKNDWNHVAHDAGVNAWIGKLADGSIGTVQAGAWDLHPWGCGSGSKGSCNGYIYNGGKTQYVNPMWLQFEICDDGYKDKNYFLKVYKEACEFTAYICKQFGIDPNGTYTFNGVKVPTIICHKDAYGYKLGSNHSDVMTWFGKFGYTMANVRKDVAALVKPTSTVAKPSTTPSTSTNTSTSTQIKTAADAKKFMDALIDSSPDAAAKFLNAAIDFAKKYK